MQVKKLNLNGALIFSNIKSDLIFFLFLCGDTNYENDQVWGVEAGAGRSRVFLAPWSRNRSHLNKKQEPEPEPLGKKSQEPEPLKN